MTKSKFFYIILSSYVLSGILGLITLNVVDYYDRLRWNIGDILRLLFFLTPFVLVFCVPKNYLHGAKSVCAFILGYVYGHSLFFLHYGGSYSTLTLL